MNFQICGCRTASPVDYKLWGITQQRLSQTIVQDVNDLMQRLMCGLEWNRALLTMPLTSSAGVSMPAFYPHEDISIIHCDRVFNKRLI